MSINNNYLNKTLNNLERVTDTNELYKWGFEIADEDRARWAIERVNQWLDEGRLVRIENNRLMFGSESEIVAEAEQWYKEMSVLAPQLIKRGREYIIKRRKELGINKKCLL